MRVCNCCSRAQVFCCKLTSQPPSTTTYNVLSISCVLVVDVAQVMMPGVHGGDDDSNDPCDMWMQERRQQKDAITSQQRAQDATAGRVVELSSNTLLRKRAISALGSNFGARPSSYIICFVLFYKDRVNLFCFVLFCFAQRNRVALNSKFYVPGAVLASLKPR